MDAHPDMVVAHELDVLKFVEAGFDLDQSCYLMIENARRCGAAGRRWGRYLYTVPGQWQGRYRSIRLLGDKKAGRTTSQIGQNETGLDLLLDRFGDRLRFVHVVRNPFDIVATLAKIRQTTVEETAESLFFLVQSVARIRRRLGPARYIDLRHESLIANPRGQLKRLCSFFELEAEQDWVEACCSIITPTSRRSRAQIFWDPALIRAIEAACKRYDFLSTYSFEN